MLHDLVAKCQQMLLLPQHWEVCRVSGPDRDGLTLCCPVKFQAYYWYISTILLNIHIQFTWVRKIKYRYIIIISIDRASKEKKSLSPKKLTIFPQKITIMKISLNYANFVNKIHKNGQMGVKKSKSRKCFHTFWLEIFQIWSSRGYSLTSWPRPGNIGYWAAGGPPTVHHSLLLLHCLQAAVKNPNLHRSKYRTQFSNRRSNSLFYPISMSVRRVGSWSIEGCPRLWISILHV